MCHLLRLTIVVVPKSLVTNFCTHSVNPLIYIRNLIPQLLAPQAVDIHLSSCHLTTLTTPHLLIYIPQPIFTYILPNS